MAIIAKFVSYDGGIAFSDSVMQIKKADGSIRIPISDVVSINVLRPKEDADGFIRISTADDRYRVLFEDDQLQEAIQFKRQFLETVSDHDIDVPKAEEHIRRIEPAAAPRRHTNKRLIIALVAIAVIVVLAFAAVAIISSSSNRPSSNPLLDLQVESWPVKNGPGTETIGIWGSVTAEKSVFTAATPEQFREFTEERLYNKDYNWYVIFFNDGTGLKLNNTPIIEYGHVDQDGTMTDTIEMYAFDEDGTYKAVSDE